MENAFTISAQLEAEGGSHSASNDILKLPLRFKA